VSVYAQGGRVGVWPVEEEVVGREEFTCECDEHEVVWLVQRRGLEGRAMSYR